MKIRKVDDKPMVIHTKEKAKIHAHEPKGAKIKGSNIYTVERGPKTIGAKVSDDKKKSYRKSTIHQSEPKNKGLSRFKRNYRESNTPIKTKNTNLHIAGRTGALAAGAVTEQVEGGHEVSQAAYLAYEASRPVTGTASKGAALFRKKAAAEAKKRIKKVEAGKKLAKKTGKKAAKDTAKTVAKETAKETAKTTAKVAAKTATKAAATAAGTAVAPGAGTAIGMAAGYAAGVSIEVKDEKMTNRSRKIKFFLDKMKAQENQTDSVAKLVKDLIVRKAITWVKAAAPIIGLVLLLLVLVVAMIAVPVIAVIAILYNSPFALFLPPLESGDTVQTVTSAYVQEFNRDVNTKVNEHTGYDLGELVYVDYEGMEENPSNYYDIMAVYMVKHGVGDTATVMNDTSKGWLQAVVNDMCSYTTSLDEIRQITRELIHIQMDGCSEEELSDKQRLLNVKYDAFIKQYGAITSKANRIAFRDDSDYPLLCSLEEVNEDGEVKKADMFYKQTIKAKTVIDRVETAVEALNVSVNEFGYVNLAYMLSIYEPDITMAMEELAEKTGQTADMLMYLQSFQRTDCSFQKR